MSGNGVSTIRMEPKPVLGSNDSDARERVRRSKTVLAQARAPAIRDRVLTGAEERGQGLKRPKVGDLRDLWVFPYCSHPRFMWFCWIARGVKAAYNPSTLAVSRRLGE